MGPAGREKDGVWTEDGRPLHDDGGIQPTPAVSLKSALEARAPGAREGLAVLQPGRGQGVDVEPIHDLAEMLGLTLNLLEPAPCLGRFAHAIAPLPPP